MDHIKFSKMNIKDFKKRGHSNPGAKKPPKKLYKDHSTKLLGDLDDQIKKTKDVCNKIKFNPYLVMKIELEDGCVLSDKEIEKFNYFGFEIISNEDKQIQVVFSEDTKLENFKKAIEDYKNKVIATKHVKNEELLNKIKSINEWGIHDRLTFSIDDLCRESYVDCFLWVFDTLRESKEKVNEFKAYLNTFDDIKITDTYVSKSLVLVRFKVFSTKRVKEIAENPLVFKMMSIKYEKKDSNYVNKILDIDIDSIKYDNSNINEKSPSICVIDSGVNAQHPLFKGIIGETKTFFIDDSSSESRDLNGHGTAVASICEYGDFDYKDKFIPTIYIHSAKIHNGNYIHPLHLALIEFKENIEDYNVNLEFAINDYINECIDFEYIFNYIDDANISYFKMLAKKYSTFYDKAIPNQMNDIVNYFYKTYDCRIFNLSQGNKLKPYRDGKIDAWACALDEIQNEKDVVFIVSTGNYLHENCGNISEIIKDYPKYFYFNNKSRIVDPATSVTSVTVGGLAISEEFIEDNFTIGLNLKNISNKNIVSSISRVGPGPQGCIKPEFVAYSGDRGIGENFYTSKIVENKGLEKLVFSNENALFSFKYGTSFAAPYISHILAKIQEKYPDASCNLLRAILATSSEYNNRIDSSLEDIKDYDVTELNQPYKRLNGRQYKPSEPKIRLNTYGYGYPNYKKCLDSFDNRVALIADNLKDEDCLEQEELAFYKVPIPKSFRSAKGKKKIIVSLAFNPEVKNTRFDYMGTSMSFELIKGHEITDIINSIAKVKKEDIIKIPDRYKCKVALKSEITKGTLQKGIYTFTNDVNFDDELYLVIERGKGWSTALQKYAIAVVLESSDEELKIYDEIKNQIEQNVEIKNINKQIRI